jgi:DNA-binding transcriptional LysR family regulator
MEQRHLRHFLAPTEERSFTKAGARERIAQSGPSTSVRALEKELRVELGVELIIRGSRPVRLTAEGEALLPAARPALDSLDAAKQAAHAVRDVLTGSLRAAAGPGRGGHGRRGRTRGPARQGPRPGRGGRLMLIPLSDAVLERSTGLALPAVADTPPGARRFAEFIDTKINSARHAQI